MTLALIGFWLLAGQVPAPSDAIAQADAEGLAELRSTYLNAYAAGDNDAMASVYMPDAVRMPYDSPAQQGRAAILDAYERSFASRPFKPHLEFTVEDLLVRGDLAIERGRYREELHPIDGGAALLELGKYVAVARKDADGEWRYQATIFNRDGPPAPLRAAAREYRKAGGTVRCLESGSGTTIDVLVDAGVLGGREVELARITFPAGLDPARSHRHGAVEIFYVLSGTLAHVVNGVTHVLEPGSVGVVRPDDEVIHRVRGDAAVEALVVWAPAGELRRIEPLFEECDPTSHVERARELRRLMEAGNHQAARAYMADDPRRWWESREGEGAPWIVGPQQRWAAWDRHFRSRKDVVKWTQSGNRATVLVRETNDYYELLEREPAMNEAVYYFDAHGKIEGLLIRAAGERSPGRTDEFIAWAERNAPYELDLLMSGGEIDPSRPERFRRLLNRWRIDAGLDAIGGNPGTGP